MADRTPLPTLLSALLVAYTIEFDNEAERRIKALNVKRRFLVSMVMWSNFMRYVGEAAIPLRDVEGLAKITNLSGLERWGYVAVEPDPADRRPKPPRRDWLIRATQVGLLARQVWQPLPEVIDQRWRDRFGGDEVAELRQSLSALVSRSGGELPRYLPVVNFGNGMLIAAERFTGRLPPEADDGAEPDLSVLLSRALLLFGIEFEAESARSLTICANLLRVVDQAGVAVRDLPRLAGVSKEGISSALGFLGRRGLVVVEPDPAAARTKLARLTPAGLRAQDAYHRLLTVVEERWQERFGRDRLGRLRDALEGLLGQADGGRPRLSLGLQPPAEGWRARRPYLTQTTAMLSNPVATLPHFPMVLHRGGWPDGS